MSKKFQDPRGGHVRIYWNVVDSVAWKALSFSQQALYVAMRRRLTSNSNGNISATVSTLRQQGFDISSSALASGLRALLAVGLIATTRSGGAVGRGQVIATLYRFTDDVSHEWRAHHIPAFKSTNEWRRFELVSEALTAIKDADEAASVEHAKKQSLSAEKKRRLEIHERTDLKFRTESTRNSRPEAFSGAEIRVVRRSAELAQSFVH